MKVVVIFDFPEITDPSSKDAELTINSLGEDLLDFGDDTGHVWRIDSVEGD